MNEWVKSAEELHDNYGRAFPDVPRPNFYLRALRFVRLTPDSKYLKMAGQFYSINGPELSFNQSLQAYKLDGLRRLVAEGKITMFCAVAAGELGELRNGAFPKGGFERPVGYVSLLTPEFANLSYHTLLWPCVAKSARKLGVATYLILALLGYAAAYVFPRRERTRRVAVKTPTWPEVERLVKEKFGARPSKEKEIMYDLLLIEF